MIPTGTYVDTKDIDIMAQTLYAITRNFFHDPPFDVISETSKDYYRIKVRDLADSIIEELLKSLKDD